MLRKDIRMYPCLGEILIYRMIKKNLNWTSGNKFYITLLVYQGIKNKYL
jgi:hypothetical protein